MPLRKHFLVAGFATAVLLVVASDATTAQAGTITYDITADCRLNCAEFGLDLGDPIGDGFITFDDANFAPGAILGTADVTAFAIDFGDISLDNTTAVGLFFQGELRNDALTIDFAEFVAAEALGPDQGELITLRLGRVFASIDGACADSDCIVVDPGSSPANAKMPSVNLRPSSIEAPSHAAVPAPGGLGLMSVALIGLAVLRRRRSAAAPAAGQGRLFLLGAPLAAALALLTAGGVSAPAQAGVIAYDFDITCELDCDLVGLDVGDKGSGFFALDAAAFLVDAFVDQDALVDFAVEFGSVTIDASTANAVIFNAKLDNPDTLALSLIAIALFDAIAPDSGDFFFANLVGSVIASTNASCIGDRCGDAELGDQARGRLGPLLPRIVDVPEPGGLALLGAALFGLFTARRRRQPVTPSAGGRRRGASLAAPLAAAFAFLAAAGVAAPARAGVITYDLSAACVTDCVTAGLDAGDPVSGFLSFDDANFAAGAVLNDSDLVAFAVEFGDIAISDATAQAFRFAGTLGADALSLTPLLFFAVEALPPDLGDTVTIAFNGLQASTNGSCFPGPGGPGDCSAAFILDVPAQATLPTLTPRLAAVPEPGGLGLALVSLGGLLVFGRRYAVRTVRAKSNRGI